MDPRSQGSGEARSSEPRFLAVGRVLRPHGLRGEVRVEIHTDSPERFALYEQVYLAPAQTNSGPSGLLSAASTTTRSSIRSMKPVTPISSVATAAICTAPWMISPSAMPAISMIRGEERSCGAGGVGAEPPPQPRPCRGRRKRPPG